MNLVNPILVIIFLLILIGLVVLSNFQRYQFCRERFGN